MKHWNIHKALNLWHAALFRSFFKWIWMGGTVGILSGSASAIFLIALEYVTDTRLQNPWLLYLLPLGGALVSFLYWKFGKNSAKGNNLIIEQIHNGNEAIPLRMAPLVLFGTLITHLFGGSAGREGTAVQMGGSLAERFGKWIKAGPVDRKILLMCGISGGFGSVFGTPLAGTVFGLEVAAIGLIQYEALLPCFTASFVGHLVTTQLWGAHHVHYPQMIAPELSLTVLLKVTAASLVFALASICFSELTHALKKLFAKVFHNPMLKSVVGGMLIIGLVFIIGSREYLGLSIPLLTDAFHQDVPTFAFLWKLIFTSITLGAGFQGGEVTPLFVIGATLGHTLADLFHMYGPFLAALGFIAVFCGATHTPIACFLMGIELFGSDGAVYMFIACLVSYLFSGYSGIYTSQRIGISKSHLISVPPGTTLATRRNLLFDKRNSKAHHEAEETDNEK
ncbi:voltage-gated chloride channel family protein [Paenibacillus sp. KQZ6P-2]|uniref:Voltage-gated chloride channel family protein n=1 Tax=Paenibacillus mangrovi TaxID=2931978 RepID=A0A9X1WUF4_9BACL|nr:voltage-gated chloride channel family protein [Paenibacillus mangrovi]MCJ8014796.1 voltage-gated chloride channel family protein [Paenibacillus mangrovi]